MSVMVPTVERGLLPMVFCSIEITGESPNTKSTSGFATCATKRLAYWRAIPCSAAALRRRWCRRPGSICPTRKVR